MKREIFSVMILFVIATLALGQETIHIKEVNVSPPKFKGVENAVQVFETGSVESIDEYLIKNFNYEYSLTDYMPEGVEVVRFVINPSGELSDFDIINSLSPKVDEEIIRVLKTTDGMWLPGIRDEKAVAMEKEVSLALRPDIKDREKLQDEFVERSRKHFERAGEKFLVEGHPRRALKYYNWSSNYTPNDKAMLLMRGLCKYELNDKDGAREDWQRLFDLGGVDYVNIYLGENIQKLSGYQELLCLIEAAR